MSPTAQPAGPSAEGLEARLASARAAADERGSRWTGPRERVYELILRAERPIGAYEILPFIYPGRSASPPTVYRALQFLEDSGLINRIASLNAYVPALPEDRSATGAFLVCSGCGSATRMATGALDFAGRAADAAGFEARSIALEVRGRCEACRCAA